MASEPEFGELTEKTFLREYWPNEERDFSRWLSREDRLRLLGNALDMDLVLRGVEERVGPFEADLVAIQRNEDERDDDLVIIENQLGRTDHDHLGKLLTYAAGLRKETTKSLTLVWIAKEVREEHQDAIDWLNLITDEKTDFFAVEIKVWQIGSSLPAPRFHVVSRPDRRVGARTTTLEARDRPEEQTLFDFWQAFKDSLHGPQPPLNEPRPKASLRCRLGRSGFGIHLKVLRQDKKLRCSLMINHSDSLRALDLLRNERAAIESQVGSALSGWNPIPGQRRQILYVERSDSDIARKDEWPEYFAWFSEQAQRFYQTFLDRVQKLPLGKDEEVNDGDPVEES